MLPTHATYELQINDSLSHHPLSSASGRHLSYLLCPLLTKDATMTVYIESRHANQPIHPFLQPSTYLVYATIGNPDDFQGLPSAPMMQALQQKYSSGLLSSGLTRLKDLNKEEGAFFVFANLGVKMEGTFMIMFTLFEIDG